MVARFQANRTKSARNAAVLESGNEKVCKEKIQAMRPHHGRAKTCEATTLGFQRAECEEHSMHLTRFWWQDTLAYCSGLIGPNDNGSDNS